MIKIYLLQSSVGKFRFVVGWVEQMHTTQMACLSHKGLAIYIQLTRHNSHVSSRWQFNPPSIEPSTLCVNLRFSLLLCNLFSINFHVKPLNKFKLLINYAYEPFK